MRRHPCSAGSLRASILPPLLVLLLAGVPSGACLAQSAPIESLTHFPRTSLDIAAQGQRDHFEVWIADTAARQEQGLMFVRDLPPGEGMLFPEDSPQVAHFWKIGRAHV